MYPKWNPGNMDQNLRSPGGIILTHVHMSAQLSPLLLHLAQVCPPFGASPTHTPGVGASDGLTAVEAAWHLKMEDPSKALGHVSKANDVNSDNVTKAREKGKGHSHEQTACDRKKEHVGSRTRSKSRKVIDASRLTYTERSVSQSGPTRDARGLPNQMIFYWRAVGASGFPSDPRLHVVQWAHLL